MKTLKFTLFALLAYFAACGEDNTTNNNPVNNSNFSGRYGLIIEPPGGGSPIDSINVDILGTGSLSSFSITINDNNNQPIVANFSGNITNDTVVNFTSNLNYLNTTFTNVITGNMIDSNSTHYLFGTIKLLSTTIGHFSYYLPVNPQAHGSFNTPALSCWFRLRKL